ncbi:MAG TPA: hypothetical protein VMV03_03375, partial [Spirochaetia bacterium]|nr:hypothetical protein [Spirochaetia bacterium]
MRSNETGMPPAEDPLELEGGANRCAVAQDNRIRSGYRDGENGSGFALEKGNRLSGLDDARLGVRLNHADVPRGSGQE